MATKACAMSAVSSRIFAKISVIRAGFPLSLVSFFSTLFVFSSIHCF